MFAGNLISRQLYFSKSQSYSNKKGVLVLPSHYRVSRVRYTKEQGNTGKMQDTRNYKLQEAGTGWSI